MIIISHNNYILSFIFLKKLISGNQRLKIIKKRKAQKSKKNLNELKTIIFLLLLHNLFLSKRSKIQFYNHLFFLIHA